MKIFNFEVVQTITLMKKVNIYCDDEDESLKILKDSPINMSDADVTVEMDYKLGSVLRGQYYEIVCNGPDDWSFRLFIINSDRIKVMKDQYGDDYYSYDDAKEHCEAYLKANGIEAMEWKS